MALNTIILPYNKILEVEECKPVSSPSSTSFEEHKTFPELSRFNSPLFHSYNSFLISEKRNKSNPPSLNSNNLHELFFGTNSNENISVYSQKDLNNLNIDQERNYINDNIINNINNNKKYIFERIQSKVNNHQTSRSNRNPFQLANNSEENESESSENPYSYSNIRRNHRESEVIDKSKLNRIYDNYINNPKINPVKADKQIESFMDDISNADNKIRNFNLEEKNDSLKKKEIPKIKPKINQISQINLSPSYNYRNSNPNPIIKNGIYFKKRISDSEKAFKRKAKIGESSTSSINKESMKTEISRDKRPLIPRVNSRKKIEYLKISQIKKIMKYDGLFTILRFLDYYDIINLYKAKNKQLCILLNTTLVNVYYFNIKESLIKYSNFIEILKCTIMQSKIKDTLKIDFIINMRFIYNKKLPNNKHYKIKLGGANNKFIEPLYLQFGYIYNYFQKVKNKKDFITKEEYDKEIKRLKMYDYYTFDLYPEKNKNHSIKPTPIFISKELSLFEKDGNNNIVNIQPILPFYINDKGIINLELYTTNNGFIDPDSIKIVVKAYNLKNYIEMLNDKEINNPRISECEDLCVHWKNINLFQHNKSLILGLKKTFEPLFEIKNVYFGNIGVFIFKVHLKAIKSGEINDKNKLEIKIKIKEENDYVENEIRKNNLLFERRDIFELRVGEQFLYYFSLK